MIFNAGAYGYAMGSNYNARLRPLELLVDGNKLSIIRQAEKFESLVSATDPIPLTD